MSPEFKLVAGVDSSTQSVKVVVCDAESGRILRTSRAPHPPGTEVSAEQWWTAYGSATADPALLRDVEALAVGGQQHGMVTLDEAGGLVRDALLWNDNRSAGDADDLISELGGASSLGGSGGFGPGRVDDGVEDPLARPSRARARQPGPRRWCCRTTGSPGGSAAGASR